ncbi:MAG: PA14 domain-containing protein, partial [Planctomycetota bacterium]
NFAMRWSGWLLVPREGEYVFEADADDSLDVTLDGKKLVSGKWGDAKGRSAPVHCAAGLHPISATYLEWGGGAFVHLRWQPPGGGMQAIPAGYFFHEVPEPGSMGPFAKLLEGMWGEYYKDENFGRKVGEGPVEHPTVDYGDLPPLPVCPGDNFSVRMKGHILLYWSGTYRFDVDIDDGVRLKVGGERIINHWGKASTQRVSGKKELAAGYHEVEIEHMERGGNAKIHFWWVPPAYGDINNPTTYIMPRRIWFYGASRRDVVDRKGLAPGMKGSFYGRSVPGGKVLLRSLDPAASFAWGGSPGSGVPHDGFSCKWEGRLVVPANGLYSFRVRHRGGVQLAIGRRAIVSKWEDADGWQNGSIALRAGPVPVSLKYSNPRGKAEMRVYWSGPGFALRTLGGDALAHKAAALVIARPWEEKSRKVALADRAARDAAGKTGPARKAARTVTGNQVPNGGFEEMDAETRFASRWRRGQWGTRGAQYSVRIDRSNPHAGDRALAVRNLAPGALSGAETTLALPPGEYELRYWACADVGATAEVHASAAGRELRTNVAGEDWKQFTQKIEIGEDLPRVGLRLWISTPGVRAWLDDVEVVPVR